MDPLRYKSPLFALLCSSRYYSLSSAFSSSSKIEAHRKMDHKMALEHAQMIVKSLEDYGKGDYIGESISQLEHCLQAAHQAQKAGKSNYST